MIKGISIRLVRQLDAMQCGVASLAMVCGAFGLSCSLHWLSQRCFSTREGVSMKGIADASKEVGLEAVAARVSLKDMARAPMPAILHWDQNHFVVLYRVSRNGRRFHIADPAKGKYTVSDKEMAGHWLSTSREGNPKGIAMFFEPTERFGQIRDDHEKENRSIKFLREYLHKYRSHFLQIFAGLLLGCVLQLIMPFLTQAIVDRGIRDSDIGFIWLILLGELMIAVGSAVTNFIRRRLLLHISMRINVSLVGRFIEKLLRLPMSFFDTRMMGDLLQRMADHSRVQSFLTGQTLGIAFTMLSFIVFGIVLLVYSPLIFLIFLAGSIVYGIWTAMFLKKRKVIDYTRFEEQSKSQNITYRLVDSMQEIKLQGCGGRRRTEWEDAQAGLFAVEMDSLKLQQTQEAGALLINEIKNILITVLAATAVIEGEMTLGAMLAIQYIIGQFSSPVEQLMAFVQAAQDVAISLERINEVHDRQDEEARAGGCESPLNAKGISLEEVCFKYDPHSPADTLKDVSMEIERDKVTAIVGASGSGKTTLVKLMLGYYPPRSGSIRAMGRELADYSPAWWRDRCGAVMQDGVIFTDTIARNIAVADGPVDLKRLADAARTACIHEFITALPLGYDTVVGRDGTGLSQGQKQRLLIARAVYRNPDFIFLDEATNSLDARNEREIVENLAEFYRGKTVVVVAHRLSTVRDADKIIVMEGGKIVETGTHQELVDRKGAYFTLVKNQLELGT